VLLPRLPRIPIIAYDIPFPFKRTQFAVHLAYAMSINKSKSQTLQIASIKLKSPFFAHGQLYVACSRVGSAKDLFVYAPGGITKNIV